MRPRARRLARRVFTLCAALSLLLCAAVCTAWVRGRSGSDHVNWTCDRYLSDRGAASNAVHLSSDDRRLSLTVSWGRVGPYNSNLVYGYYIRADESGGRPQLALHRYPHPAERSFGDIDPFYMARGWGPLRWQSFTRTAPAPPGEVFRNISIGVSHWLAALLLLAPPALWLHRMRKTRRARRLGLCSSCGYDLRATPDRCPECGTAARPTPAPSTFA